MIKKIKLIELLNKIANGEDLPKRIKWGTVNYILKQDSLDGHLYYEKEQGCTSLVAELKTMDDLKSEVEILENNTEEIEELAIINNYSYNILSKEEKIKQLKSYIENNRDKINELVKVINSIRKEKNNDKFDN